MPQPCKPFEVLKTEKKSHRTKAELKQRQQAEESLSTGVALRERPEVKNNPVAHKEFTRLNRLLKSIKKNDAIYETIINRYCILVAECTDCQNRIEENQKLIDELMTRKNEMDFLSFLGELKNLNSVVLYTDKQLQAKRKMLFDIEKENIMTIAAALRSIPKKQEKASNPLLEALKKNG